MMRIIRISNASFNTDQTYHLSGDVHADPGEVLHVQLVDFALSVTARTNLNSLLPVDKDLHIYSNLSGVTFQNNPQTGMIEPSRLLTIVPRSNSFIYSLSRAAPPIFPIAQRALDRRTFYFGDGEGNSVNAAGSFTITLVVTSVKP